MAARFAWFGVALVIAISTASAAAARRKPKVKLATAVVHVLDAAGAPVAGVEVELLVSRIDGSEDRRRGTTCADGAASFDDVRTDCVDFQASALLASGKEDGKLRPCSDGLEAFVVLSGVNRAAASGAAVVIAPYPEDEPAAAPPAPAQPVVEAEPEPAAPPVPPEPTASIPPAAVVEGTEGPLAIGARAGVGFCQEWFYRPGPDDPKCDDNVSPALDLEIDGGFHVAEWLVLGARIGYGYFESTARFPVDDEADTGDQTDLQGVVSEGEGRVDGAGNHRLHWGLGARAIWAGEHVIAGADLVPLALLHHFTRMEGAGTETFTEFVVSAGVLAGLRIDRSWWLGVYARFFQPVPWIDDQRFLPGTLAFGVVAGLRIGREGQPATEAEPPVREPEEKKDPGVERRKRFIETQQDRGSF